MGGAARETRASCTGQQVPSIRHEHNPRVDHHPVAGQSCGRMSSQVPADLKYAKSHEWARLQGDAATVGITDHAQHELTDVVFVELPAVGRTVKAGEACAVVESVKTASDIYSPLSGVISEVNPAVVNDPSLANTAPYGDGWFFKLKLVQATEAAALLDAATYQKQIGD